MDQRSSRAFPYEPPDGLDTRFREVMDAAPVMIWASGQDKLCNWFNQPWLSFTGRTQTQELGNGWTEGVHRDDFDRCLKIYTSHFEDRKQFRMQYRLRRYDGAYRWIDDTGNPRYASDGTFVGYIGSCSDIHDYREAQAELNRHLLAVAHLNRSADAAVLAASISHELNQPLAAILANTEAAELFLMANPPDLDQLKAILADIRRDDQRAADVISHMLGLMRKKEVRFQEIDLNDAVRIVREILTPHTVDMGILLSASQEGRALPVRADPIQLQQVVLSLALNGVDAMRSDVRRERRLLLQTALADASTVEVSVLDSGTGIPADKLENIFEPFFTTKQEGTGLGLPIARAIIESHGGRIWAENRHGGGAVFRFTLPSAKVLPG
jgi:PAS domain S-box-containing protein